LPGREFKLSKKATFGVLAMEVISIYGKMNGSQITTQGRFLHLREGIFW
jgi:hypothetical protein